MTEKYYYLSMILIFVVSFIFGIIPVAFSFRVKSCPFFLSLILCLGSGVLLATSLVHMLSEVQLKLKSYASLYLCAGFLAFYIFDEVNHYCLANRKTENRSFKYENNRKKESHPEERHDTACLSETSPTTESKSLRNYGTMPNENYLDWSHEYFSDKTGEGGFQTESQQDLLDPYLPSENNFQKEEQYSSNVVSITGLLLALFVHSVMEGISVGVQTIVSQMLMISGALLFHKLVLAFCLGLELHHQGFRTVQLFISIFFFSVGTPIGIFIGMIVTSTENNIFDMISQLQAIAAGNLLYVAVIEVLQRERLKWQNCDSRKGAGILQLIFLLLGFVFITLLHFFVGHVNN